MKSYLLALIVAAGLALVLGTAWYTLFGYDPYISMPENVVAIYSDITFWKGLLIWTALYAIFVTIPLTYLKSRALRS